MPEGGMCASQRWLEDARVVPWSSWCEWGRLRAALEAGDTAWAERYASVYQVRRAAGLPVALQASVTLATQCGSFGGTYSERLALAMMLARLVNGLTDRLQPTGAGARAKSVRVLAAQLDLPSELVALRHQACHNALPGATVLAAGAAAARRWLEKRYWEEQARAASAERRGDTIAELRAVFEGALGHADDAEVADREDELTGEDVLVRMKRITAEMEARREMHAEAAVRAERKGRVGSAKKRRWTLCGNEVLWKRMPLGLCPGQTEVCTALTGFEEGELGEEDVEGDGTEDGDAGDAVGPGDAVGRAKKRRLNEDEKATLRMVTQILLMDAENPVGEVKDFSNGEQA